MLVIQVLRRKNVVHAFCEKVLASVYPDGSFMGFRFEELVAMGTGQHAVEPRDRYDFQRTGTEPTYESAWRADVAKFEYVLFGYQTGTYTALEVLSLAGSIWDEERKRGATSD